MTKKVTILQGLPGSGKTTYAKSLQAKNKGNIKRVNKDELRAMLDDSHYSKANEKFVLRVRDHLIVEALKDGKHVIVDDTNLSDKHERRITELVKEFNKEESDNVVIETKFIDTPVQECIERDLKRPNSVGQKVIYEMYNKFLKPRTKVQKPFDPKKPSCVICDIDGTLALMNDRSPYDYSKVGEDQINHPVRDIIKSFFEKQMTVILLSGRDSVCRKDTENWLSKHSVGYDQLFMRAEGDQRADTIVKKEMYEQHIENRYNVHLVLDDRPRIVQMWRDEGLLVADVGHGIDF
jgi:predicted kinase